MFTRHSQATSVSSNHPLSSWTTMAVLKMNDQQPNLSVLLSNNALLKNLSARIMPLPSRALVPLAPVFQKEMARKLRLLARLWSAPATCHPRRSLRTSVPSSGRYRYLKLSDRELEVVHSNPPEESTKTSSRSTPRPDRGLHPFAPPQPQKLCSSSPDPKPQISLACTDT